MIRAIVILVCFLVVWISGYASGVLPWMGYASMTRSSFGAGPISIIGENRRGIDIGLETMLLFEGQEVVIEYDTTLRAGALWFYVYQPFDGELGEGDSEYILASGKGVWTRPITKTAFYTISIDASPRGQGYDLDYTVKWGARFRK